MYPRVKQTGIFVTRLLTRRGRVLRYPYFEIIKIPLNYNPNLLFTYPSSASFSDFTHSDTSNLISPSSLIHHLRCSPLLVVSSISCPCPFNLHLTTTPPFFLSFNRHLLLSETTHSGLLPIVSGGVAYLVIFWLVGSSVC